jgi:hypothetical protein
MALVITICGLVTRTCIFTWCRYLLTYCHDPEVVWVIKRSGVLDR